MRRTNILLLTALLTSNLGLGGGISGGGPGAIATIELSREEFQSIAMEALESGEIRHNGQILIPETINPRLRQISAKVMNQALTEDRVIIMDIESVTKPE